MANLPGRRAHVPHYALTEFLQRNRADSMKIIEQTFWIDIVAVVSLWFFLYKAGTKETADLTAADEIATVGLVVISLFNFFRFYKASLVWGGTLGSAMRTGMAAAFVTLYLTILTFSLVMPHMFSSLFGDNSSEFAKQIYSGFSSFIVIIMGFYFVSQTFDEIALYHELAEIEREEIRARNNMPEPN